MCIHDSSKINLYNHRNRIQKDESIGLTNAFVGGLGFFIHQSFIIDADTLIVYGFSDVKIWNRGHELLPNMKTKTQNRIPIEEKESYRWIDSSLETKKRLTKAKEIIIIQDREGDMYEQFCLVPDNKTRLLIRSRFNHMLDNKVKLFDHLSSQQLQGMYAIELEGDKRRNIQKRTAAIEVGFSEITMAKHQYLGKHLPEKINLYAIEAKEVGENIENPILWRLLTTKKIEDLQTALLCIQWYTYRWTIEEVFRILKKEGFNIKASELSQGKAVRKLCLLILETIIKLFIMQIAYASEEETEPRSCFSEEAIECLELQITQLEGKTEKLKNPCKSSDVKRYIWAIARLGGWKGYLSERKPGITTFWIGLQKFNSVMQG